MNNFIKTKTANLFSAALFVLTTSQYIQANPQNFGNYQFDNYKDAYLHCERAASDIVYNGSPYSRTMANNTAQQYCGSDPQGNPVERLMCLESTVEFLSSYKTLGTYEKALPALDLCLKEINYLCLEPTARNNYDTTPNNKSQSADYAIQVCAKHGGHYGPKPHKPGQGGPPIHHFPPPIVHPVPPPIVHPVPPPIDHPVPQPPPVVKPVPKPPPPPQPLPPVVVNPPAPLNCDLPVRSYTFTGGQDQSQTCPISFGFARAANGTMTGTVNGQAVTGKITCDKKGNIVRIWFTQNGGLFQVGVANNGQVVTANDNAFCNLGLVNVN